MVPAKPRRRWFRFSLRSLLVFIALVGIGAGWIANKRAQSRRELAIAAQLEVYRASVTLRYPFVIESPSCGFIDEPRARSWWRKQLGNLLGPTVEDVFFLIPIDDAGKPVPTLPDLALLSSLTHLERLNANSCRINDLRPLANLTSLESLSLDGTKISDLSPLAGLKNLRRLHVNDTRVPKQQIGALQKVLPNCKIEHDFRP